MMYNIFFNIFQPGEQYIINKETEINNFFPTDIRHNIELLEKVRKTQREKDSLIAEDSDITHSFLLNNVLKFVCSDQKSISVKPGNAHITILNQPLFCEIISLICSLKAFGNSKIRIRSNSNLDINLYDLLKHYKEDNSDYFELEYNVTKYILLFVKAIIVVNNFGTQVGYFVVLDDYSKIIRRNTSFEEAKRTRIVVEKEENCTYIKLISDLENINYKEMSKLFYDRDIYLLIGYLKNRYDFVKAGQ